VESSEDQGKRTRKLKNSICFWAAILFVSGAASLGHSADEVRIQKTTKVLDEKTLEKLKTLPESRVLVFESATPSLESLSPGDVIVGGVSQRTPDGLSPRRVVAIQREGDRIVITTEPATLEDVIGEGEINLEQKLKAPGRSKKQ